MYVQASAVCVVDLLLTSCILVTFIASDVMSCFNLLAHFVPHCS